MKRSASRQSISRKLASLGQTLLHQRRSARGRGASIRAPPAAPSSRACAAASSAGSSARSAASIVGCASAVGRDHPPGQFESAPGLPSSAPMRAPASACALDRVRRIASVEKRSSQRVQARRARPLDVGLVDHDDGLAVERRADRSSAAVVEQIAGRIVRRAQVHELDVRLPGRQQPLGIERPAALAVERHLDARRRPECARPPGTCRRSARIAESHRCRRAGKCATAGRWLRRCRASRAASRPATP